MSGEPHFEYTDGKDAALLASMPVSVAHDPAKQGLVDALAAPVIWRETFRLVSSLVCKVEALSVDVESVKAGQAQVSGVLVELHRLADAFAKFDNLDKLPEITESLQKLSSVLGQLVNADSQRQVRSSSGGKDYVS